MYSPFAFNDLLGPLLALSCFALTAKLVLALWFLNNHLEREEKDSARKLRPTRRRKVTEVDSKKPKVPKKTVSPAQA